METTPDNLAQTFQSWIATTDKALDVTNLRVTSVSTLLSASNDLNVSDRAYDIGQALTWVLENPERHRVKGRLVIDSDWAEFGLLSPGCFLKCSPHKQEDIVITPTKIVWGTPGSHKVRRQVAVESVNSPDIPHGDYSLTCCLQLSFMLENDGSPIRFETSHGSDGSRKNNGSCIVTLANVSSEQAASPLSCAGTAHAAR